MADSPAGRIETDRDGDVVVVTIVNEARANSLDDPMLKALAEALAPHASRRIELGRPKSHHAHRDHLDVPRRVLLPIVTRVQPGRGEHARIHTCGEKRAPW